MLNIGTLNVAVPKFIAEGDPACAEVDPELFFPIGDEVEEPGRKSVSSYRDFKAAKNICDGCELKMKCLEYALRNYEYGIWGGTTELQRTHLRRSMSRALKKRSI